MTGSALARLFRPPVITWQGRTRTVSVGFFPSLIVGGLLLLALNEGVESPALRYLSEIVYCVGMIGLFVPFYFRLIRLLLGWLRR